MDPAVATTPASAPPPAFEDGLGERRHTLGAGNEPLEVLRLNTVLSAVSSFEFALRERAGRLATFRHPSYGRVRAVERLDKLASTLVVVSEHVPGVRLAELLRSAEARSLQLEIDAARCLIRQLVSAIAALHETVPDLCHGALGPERIIIKPDGRLVIVEYVLGAALEQLRYSQERYWRELGIALPTSVGPARFDPLTDVIQMGTVVLALLLGRRLRSDEYPAGLAELVAGASVRSSTGEIESLPTDLREWLLRALQLDPHGSFASVLDARANLDFALGDANAADELATLEAFLKQSATPASAGSIPPVPVLQVSASETSAENDPTPGLEALRSFLSRYPSRETPERTPVKPLADSDVAPAPAARVAVPAAPPPENRAQAPVPVAQPIKSEPVSAPQIATPVAPSFKAEPAPAPGLLSPSAATEAVTTSVGTWPRHWLISAAIALVVLTTGATLVGLWYLMPSANSQPKGTLVVGTNPGGVGVFVDGAKRGITPLSLELPVGNHVIELVSEAGNRKVPVRIIAGGQVSQFIEMPRVPGTGGSLQVRTDPSRVEVVLDGKRVGRSPLTLQDLTPGVHTVVLESETGSLTQQVAIVADATASLVVSMSKPQNANAAGWITVTAPADVQVFEGQRLLGTNRSDRIMMPVGRHELEIVNEALGYRATRTVDIQAGQISAVRPEWPQGTLALNATPWAEVWIDGERIGETPIGNVQVSIGAHEIIFRHPELGERRAYATVTLGPPTRVGVDLRTK